ncbi:MAG: hypothetical protein A3F68_13550 [Acidobacteria bacterium RIFCSPLOWO2_12_FULL_54_10]|nr:MAG: hypothetical protein A3F68_13550 [Acidobacteria bacterium RIFCSPLOWO2_12_FULL_54_10]
MESVTQHSLQAAQSALACGGWSDVSKQGDVAAGCGLTKMGCKDIAHAGLALRGFSGCTLDESFRVLVSK